MMGRILCALGAASLAHGQMFMDEDGFEMPPHMFEEGGFEMPPHMFEEGGFEGGGPMFEMDDDDMPGMMMGGPPEMRRAAPPREWPKSENPEVTPEFEWIVNTEWKGKKAKYLFLRGGEVESSLKECQEEHQCLWAANNERVIINTPKMKIVKFMVEGLEQVDRKKLEQKDVTELRKLKLVAEKASKTGKTSTLEFEKVAQSADESNAVTKDLYKVLQVEPDAQQSEIKSKYRKLSVKHHPDKGGDAKLFDEIRVAYEMLSNSDKRRYYDMGGAQLVANMENLGAQIESEKLQLNAQLSEIPKHHPERRNIERQIKMQKQQLEEGSSKHELEKKLRSDDLDVEVPVSAAELYDGASNKTFNFKRLIICRGCRAEPDADHCADCGRCPPEKVQVPKYANTPFGKQVVSVKEKDVESLERCREVQVPIHDISVKKGAAEGSMLRYVSDMGHQTPGKIPGRIVLKVLRGSPDDIYSIAEANLHTVLHVSLEEALFGFSHSWTHLGDETVTVARPSAQGGDVVRVSGKGLVKDSSSGGGRGDLYVRLAVGIPRVGDKTSVSFQKTEVKTKKAKLTREGNVQMQGGVTWRRWAEHESAMPIIEQKTGRQEL